MSFSISYPTFLIKALSPVSTLGSSSEMIVSYDCLLKDTRLNLFGSSDFIFKIFISCFTPALLIFMAFVFFSLLKACL